MNRSLLYIGIVLLSAFGAVALWKHNGSEVSGDRASLREEKERERLKNFWDAYHEATRRRSQEEYEGAVESYREALRLNPAHEESLYYLGNCLLELGKYEAALEAYQHLIRINPSSQRGYSQLGTLLSSPVPGGTLQPEKAKKAFYRSIEINREESGPFLRLGLLELGQGELEAAFEHFQTAAGFRSPEGYFLAGLTRFRQGRDQEAIRLFQKVLEAQAREREIGGRGVLSEGDLGEQASVLLKTPLDAAAVKSRALLFWSAVRLGGYPDHVPAQQRVRRPPTPASWVPDPALPLLTFPLPGRGSWVDLDTDGDLDLSLLTSSSLRVFRNQEGRLVEVSPLLVPAAPAGGWEICWGDVDGDGRPDPYVVGSGPVGRRANTLYHNQGEMAGEFSFRDVTREAGLEGIRSTARAAFVDLDRDGTLELLEVGASDEEHPALRLWVNQGGTFREQSRQWGLEVQGIGVDLAYGDYDSDNLPDLAILRWRHPLLLFRNRGDGTFQEVTEEAGLNGVGRTAFSFLFLDYNRDGRLDLLVANHAPYEVALLSFLQPLTRAAPWTLHLFRNAGEGRFQEVTEEVGLTQACGVRQAAAGDVDGDGWPDLVCAAGGLEDYRLEPSLVLKNRQGQGFVLDSYLPEEGRPINSPGAALADWDGDGKAEVYLAGAGLYRRVP